MRVPSKISRTVARKRHPDAVRQCLAALARGQAATRLKPAKLTWHYEYCVDLKDLSLGVILLAKGPHWWWREAVDNVPPEVDADARRLRLGPYSFAAARVRSGWCNAGVADNTGEMVAAAKSADAAEHYLRTRGDDE